jgi:cyanophycin synthetase
MAGLLDRSRSADEVIEAAAAVILAAPDGPGPSVLTPTVPVASVTGTNGKTTTTRLMAHMCMSAGLKTAWSSTDGVVVMGETKEEGDFSGPAGARGVLETPGLEIGILETARGGMLLKGMGVTANDVSVVTNVSADHLGLQGIDTLDQLAEVKAVVPRITRPRGWAVLNGDDPRVFAMRAAIRARPWVFSRDPNSPAIRETLAEHGRATTVIDGWVAVLEPGSDADPLVELVDVPMTLSGLSRFNVENTLAATSAALAAGISRDVVVEGLRTFRPDVEHNPGRMNLFTVPVVGGGATVVIDLAHNEAGLEALLEIMAGVRPPGARLLLGLGAVGDRTDELLGRLGEIGAMGADVVAIAHKERYLRGRTRAELDALLRAGAERVGVTDITSYDTEVECLAGLVGVARAGDVVGLMCHAQRDEVYAWIEEQGGTPDAPEDLAAKVRAAHA